MKKYLLSLMLLLGVGATAIPAAALPFVQAGSSYTFYLQGDPGEVATLASTTFDDQAEVTLYGNTLLTVSESETALVNGQSRITVNLRADGSLFTDAAQTAVFGIGVDENADGFDFLSAVSLDNATLTFYGASGLLATFTDLQQYVTPTSPWNGIFGALGFNEETLDTRLVTGISIDFLVSSETTAVPEPDSIFLCGIGMFAALMAGRRRRRA